MAPSVLSKRIQKKIKDVLGRIPSMLLLVNIKQQKLRVVRKNKKTAEYVISTSKYGIGNKENSFKTPLGIHRVIEKYGDGAPVGRIFKDRLDTGKTWKPGDAPDDYVLTRILRLEGLEPGFNKGPGIDSYERYIYIHGTSREKKIGTPISHGCVVMKNIDVIKLYDRVKAGTIVVID
jgi:lipoprotein-anchoring transpeptidase ErfK/SrfK